MTITADLEASTYFVQIIRNCANRVKGGGCYFCDDITDIQHLLIILLLSTIAFHFMTIYLGFVELLNLITI